jgi:hypothetical protein
MEVIDVKTLGSLATSTYFRNDNKQTIKVEVRIRTHCSVVNQLTTFYYNMYLRKYKGRKFRYIMTGNNQDKDKYSQWIDEQSLYIAYHNHWNNINPLKQFSKTYLNGNPTSFSVEPVLPDKPNEIKTLRADNKFK